MSLIARHINYLLRRHDCVVVPGFGAFVAQYQPARIDAIRGMILPPSRTVGFNNEVSHDDGLLISSVSRQLSISYDRAADMVAEEVNAWKRQLDNDHEIAMPRLGRLTLTTDGLTEFEPFEVNEASMPYMALPSVKAIPLKEIARSESQEAAKRQEVVISLSRNWLKIAASVIVLVCLGAFLSTPVSLTETQLASLATPAISTITEDEISTDFELPVIPRGAMLNIAIPMRSEAMAIADTTSVHFIKADCPIRFLDTDKYCLVVASLPTRALAEQYMDENPGHYGVLEKEGKFRVYAATGQSIAEAGEPSTHEEFSAKYPGSWVCRR